MSKEQFKDMCCACSLPVSGNKLDLLQHAIPFSQVLNTVDHDNNDRINGTKWWFMMLSVLFMFVLIDFAKIVVEHLSNSHLYWIMTFSSKIVTLYQIGDVSK